MTPADIAKFGLATKRQALQIAGGNGFASGIRTVLLGHSYIDQESSSYTYNRPVTFARGTFAWANTFLHKRLTLVKELGVGGERTKDLIARLYQLAQYAPIHVIVLSIGINDLKQTQNPGNSPVTGLPYTADANQTNLEYVISQYEQILQACLATGALTVVMGETSPGNGAGDLEKHLAVRTMQLNRWLEYRCSQLRGLVYSPVDRAIIDPTSTSGDVKSGMYYDQIHPSNVGGFVRGKVLAATLKPFLPQVDRLPYAVVDTFGNCRITGTTVAGDGQNMTITLPNTGGTGNIVALRAGDRVTVACPGATQFETVGVVASHSTTQIVVPSSVVGSYTGNVYVSNSRQLFDNPLFLAHAGGSSNTITVSSGTVPANCTMSGTAGTSVAISYESHTDADGAADGYGDWLKLVVTAAGANDVLQINLRASRYGAPYATDASYGRVRPGDIVRSAFDVDAVSLSSVSTLEGRLQANYTPQGQSQTTLLVVDLYKDGANTSAHPNQAFRGVLETPEYRLPSGGTIDAVDFGLYLSFSAAGSATVRIGRAGCWRVEHPVRPVDDSLSVQ